MKFGYENEYFIKDSNDKIVRVPFSSWPHDASMNLVEVRSDPFSDPQKVLKSFKKKYAELKKMVTAKGYTLVNLPQYNGLTSMYDGGAETAGFHIHFSDPKWDGKFSHNAFHNPAPDSIADIIDTLDNRFRPLFTGIKRHSCYWRGKWHGWEYRRLPATVDPKLVTKVLIEEFCS